MDVAQYLAGSAALAWVMIMTAASLRTRVFAERSLKIALGNRDDVPEPSPLVGRAERAARNMLENLVLFVALALAARLSNADESRVRLGAALFFWARVAYFPVYLGGVRYLRTLVWVVSVGGLGAVFAAVL